MTSRQADWIAARIRDERPRWTLLTLDPVVLDQADRLARTQPVKTLDALHLASLMVFAAETGLRVPLVTGDDQQRRAGEALGLDVIFVR